MKALAKIIAKAFKYRQARTNDQLFVTFTAAFGRRLGALLRRSLPDDDELCGALPRVAPSLRFFLGFFGFTGRVSNFDGGSGSVGSNPFSTFRVEQLTDHPLNRK